MLTFEVSCIFDKIVKFTVLSNIQDTSRKKMLANINLQVKVYPIDSCQTTSCSATPPEKKLPV